MTKPPNLKNARADEFFSPGVDPGFALVHAEDLGPHLIDPVRAEGMALVSDVEQRLRLVDSIAGIETSRRWAKGFVFQTLLAVAEDVRFIDRHMTIGGKYVMNSAGGVRLRNRYAAVGPPQGDRDADAALIDHIAEQRLRNREPLPVSTEDVRALPFVIEVRNYFNFYHFTKEALPLLTLVEQYGLTGRIVMITGGRAEPEPFVRNLIDTWFPEIAPRVELLRDPQHFDRALFGFDTLAFYYQCHEGLMPTMSTSPASRRASLGNMSAAAMNSYEAPVAALRARVLERCGPADAKRRIYVKRRSGRERRVVGGEALERRLTALGFETVFFEDMSVAEQARCVSGAECMVSLHGAGMTNMLFAPQGALIVELSNAQTLASRYGVFDPLALAAGVRYLHVFLDHDFPDPHVVPVISRDGLRGVAMTEFEAAVISARIAVISARINAELNPDAAEAALTACRALNSAGRHQELALRLAEEEPLLAHEPDWHVWMANCAGQTGNKTGALGNLRHAMVLAPHRIPLLRRIMTLAHALGDHEAFVEATACFMQRAPRKAEDFLRENAWSVEGAA